MDGPQNPGLPYHVASSMRTSTPKKHRKGAYRLLPIISIISGLIYGCSPTQPLSTTQPDIATAFAVATPTDIWESLQERSPYPFTTPLPPPDFTSIDGTYVKQEPMELLGEHIHCRRCPDWLYEGGLWKLQFDRGVYRVLHVDLGWKSLGSYTVSGNRLLLFNDPNCIDDTGVYQWQLENGVLTFQVIDDPCAILLRGKNLAHLPWHSCQPSNQGGVDGSRSMPEGCD